MEEFRDERFRVGWGFGLGPLGILDAELRP